MAASTSAEIQRFLADFPAWSHTDECLSRTYRFADFAAAFGWMTQVAIVAERLGHHPEWRNVWATVDVRLRTHDAGNVVTGRDLELATLMEGYAAPLLSAHRGEAASS